MTTSCDCSDEYGPCENHAEILVVREGASTRTADELVWQLIDDLVYLGGELSPWGREVFDEAASALFEEDYGSPGVNWIDPATHEGLAQSLYDVAWQLESSMPDLVVSHNDGYVIMRPHDDCPLYLF